MLIIRNETFFSFKLVLCSLSVWKHFKSSPFKHLKNGRWEQQVEAITRPALLWRHTELQIENETVLNCVFREITY